MKAFMTSWQRSDVLYCRLGQDLPCRIDVTLESINEAYLLQSQSALNGHSLSNDCHIKTNLTSMTIDP